MGERTGKKKNFFSKLNPKKWFKSTISNETELQKHSPSMDIRTFVKEAIVGIVSGIQDAQKEYSNDNTAIASLICPTSLPGGGTRGYSDKMHEIEFDLAVTLTEESSSKVDGKAGLVIKGIYEASAGISAVSVGSHAAVNRIRFKVPIRYPLMEVKKPDYDTQKKVSNL